MFFVLAPLRQRGEWLRNRNLRALCFFLALTAAPVALSDQRADAEQLLDRAANETDAGDYDAAVRDAQRAAAIFAALRDGTNQADALNQAGLARMFAGSYPAARALFDQALRVAGDAHAVESMVEERMNLASVDFFTARYADAAAQYAVVDKLLDAHRAKEWAPRRRRLLLANQATLDQRLGRYREALAAYRLALSDTSDVRAEEHAQMLSNLGVLYRRMGDPYKALDAYDRARAIFARDQHIDGELGVLKNRGIVLALDLGRLEEARATFAEAFARAREAGNAREMLQARLYGAETKLRLRDAAEAARDFRDAHADAVALETIEDQWKALYGLARAETLLGDDTAATRHLREAAERIEEIRDAIRLPSLKSDFFNDKREVFDALIAMRLRHGAQVQELFDLIERGHSRGWRERLALRSRIDLRSVQNALPGDALLLDYWTSSFGAAVVAVTRTSARVHRVRVDRDAIRAFVAALARGDKPLPPAPQLLSLSIDKPHLLIVTDGPLAALPFELLRANGRMLVEQHDITYLPTAALLLRQKHDVGRFAPPWTTELRAFGDPLFASAALENARRLPASAREVRTIASIVGGKSILHLGEDNRSDYLQRQSTAPLLHIATHAFADPGAIERSRIVFSATRPNGPATYLFLKEAYDLPLSHVQLAVLSACDTERGRMRAGEGIENFSRAFLAAGAESTVTTLWRVPDTTTAAFMRVFYHHLQRGASRAESLQRAKLRFIQSRAPLNEPRYWAAFVLTGDGLRPVSTAMRWETIAIIAAAVVLLIVAAVVLVRRPAPLASSLGAVSQ